MSSSRPIHNPLPGCWRPHLKKAKGVWTIVNTHLHGRLMTESEMARFVEAIEYINKQDEIRYNAIHPGLGTYLRSVTQ